MMVIFLCQDCQFLVMQCLYLSAVCRESKSARDSEERATVIDYQLRRGASGYHISLYCNLLYTGQKYVRSFYCILEVSESAKLIENNRLFSSHCSLVVDESKCSGERQMFGFNCVWEISPISPPNFQRYPIKIEF
jgi:hypothetical protein